MMAAGLTMRFGVHPAIDELGYRVGMRSGLLNMLRAQDPKRALGSGAVLLGLVGSVLWVMAATSLAAGDSPRDARGVRALRLTLLLFGVLAADLVFKPFGLMELSIVGALICLALTLHALSRDDESSAAAMSPAILGGALVYFLTSPSVPFCAYDMERIQVRSCFGNQEQIEAALEMLRTDREGIGRDKGKGGR